MLNHKKLFVFGLFLLLGLSLNGCGTRSDSSFYYYYPSFANDGKILFVLGTENNQRDIIGSRVGYSYYESVKYMYPSATGESSALFDVTGAPPYYLSCSPSRNYVAYLSDLRDNMFGKIVIRNISQSAYTGMKDAEINFSDRIVCFDWGSDGNRFVYCTTTEVRIRDWNDYLGTTDTLVVAAVEIEFVSWKYGGRIAFTHVSGGSKILSLIYPDGTGRVDLSSAVSVEKPQISPVNTAEVFGLLGSAYAKVNVNTSTVTTIAASCQGALPRIAPDATAVVYSKSGQTSGIYSLNLTTGVETQIK